MLDLWAFWGEQMAWEGLILEINTKKKKKEINEYVYKTKNI